MGHKPMTRSFRLAALVLCLPACAAPARPPTTPPEQPDSAQVSRALVQVVRRLYDTLAPGDRATWDAILDPQFVLVDRDGAVKTRREIMAELEPLPSHIKLELGIDEAMAHDLGETAVLIYLTREREEIFGQTLLVDYRNTMVFRRHPKGWRLLLWQYVEVPRDPAPVAVDPATLDAFVGEYAADEQVRYVVERRGDRLLGARAGQQPVELVPEGPGVFAQPGSEFRKIFVRDAGGRVTEMLDRRKGTDLRWRRVK